MHVKYCTESHDCVPNICFRAQYYQASPRIYQYMWGLSRNKRALLYGSALILPFVNKFMGEKIAQYYDYCFQLYFICNQQVFRHSLVEDIIIDGNIEKILIKYRIFSEKSMDKDHVPLLTYTNRQELWLKNITLIWENRGKPRGKLKIQFSFHLISNAYISNFCFGQLC